MRRLVGCVIGSSYRLKPVYGVVKLTAAPDEVSVIRWLTDFSGMMETRMMCTAAAGEARGDHFDNKSQKEEAVKATEEDVIGVEDFSSDSFKIFDHGASDMHMEVFKSPDDDGAEAAAKDSWEYFQEKLVIDPYWRSDEDIRAIFKKWSAHYHKEYTTEAKEKKRFDVFKKKMRHIDSQNYRDSVKLRLDAHCDLTDWVYILAAKKGKLK